LCWPTRSRQCGPRAAGCATSEWSSTALVRPGSVSRCEGLAREEATRRFYALDREGLITDDRVAALRAPASPLADVVANSEPTMLIGTSTQSAAFSDQIVKQMASKVERPIIMPLSNPTSKAGALPDVLIRWTGDGRWSPPAARSSRSSTRAARTG
jgi:malic enzyme